MTITEMLDYKLISLENFNLSFSSLLAAFFIIGLTKLLLVIMKKVLTRRKKLDEGRKHALLTIITYFFWVIAIALSLEAMGISVTILIAGSAALLVGIGIGLQQLFNDLMSGIFLLFEGSIEVNDTLEVDGIIGKVLEINLRTSKLLTRDDTIVIVPNHKFVSEKVLNWSHNYENTRFYVNVGVAYGTNTRLVKQLLLQVAKGEGEISAQPEPFVRFNDFGNSSLEMQLFFWSENPFGIETTRSNLRFAIDDAFRENNVTIPFPQRDLHFKNAFPGQLDGKKEQ